MTGQVARVGPSGRARLRVGSRTAQYARPHAARILTPGIPAGGKLEASMHPCSSLSTIDRIVAEARARARLAARLLRRLDPFRDDPRIAGVNDLCAVLSSADLLRHDRIAAVEMLASLVMKKLIEATAQPRPHPSREALETLYAALLDIVEAGQALDGVLAGDHDFAPGRAG